MISSFIQRKELYLKVPVLGVAPPWPARTVIKCLQQLIMNLKLMVRHQNS